MPFDLIVRGGRVIDPSQKLDAIADVAFAAGKVVMVGSELKADPGTDVRDASGYIVTPGLIDLHTHVYWGGTSLGIDAEEFCRTSGVTTAVDTGSAGPGNFAGFRKHVIEPSEVRILAYLHVSHAGIFGFSNRVMVGESGELRLMDPIDAVEVADQNRDVDRRHQGAGRPACLGHLRDRAARYRAGSGRTGRHAADGAYRSSAAELRGGDRACCARATSSPTLSGRFPIRRPRTRAR